LLISCRIDVKNLKKKKLKKQLFNSALFTLLRKYNALEIFKRELDLLKDDSSRAFKLKPLKTNDYNDLKFDIESLNFLIETKEPQILSDLFVEHERFEQVLSTLKVRSEYQVNVIQPLLEKSGIANKKVSFEEACKVIGEHKIEGLIQGTDEVYFHVDESHESVGKLIDKLHQYAKQLFPKAEFIVFDKST